MRRVTGIGGIFFKTRDSKAARDWYSRHLGIESTEHGAIFKWRSDEDPVQSGMTIWSPFSSDTKYFDPSEASFMINYRVENLDELLDQLRAEGVRIDEKREEADYGRFAWIYDPDGNKIELWEPPAGS